MWKLFASCLISCLFLLLTVSSPGLMIQSFPSFGLKRYVRDKREGRESLEIIPLTHLTFDFLHPPLFLWFTIISIIISFIQSAKADEKAANMFKSKIQNKLVLGNALIISLMALGLGFLLIAVTLLVLRARQRRLQDTSNESKSYSSLPQKDVPVN